MAANMKKARELLQKRAQIAKLQEGVRTARTKIAAAKAELATMRRQK